MATGPRAMSSVEDVHVVWRTLHVARGWRPVTLASAAVAAGPGDSGALGLRSRHA